jgi:phage-related protein
MKNVTIAGESFRQSLSTPGKPSWLTSKVLTATLQQFTSDLSDAELAAMGFNNEQIKSIQQTAKTAMHAATEVKTLSQVLDVAKETAGSGWAKTWQIIFGDFGEAKTTFTNLSNTINGFINANANARNKVLADWKALGGRTLLIDSIKTAFQNLGLILKPIKEAFRDIFPAKTGKDLFALTKQFAGFADALKPSVQTVENLKRTFAGIFAVFSIMKQVVSGVFTVFKELFGALGGGSGGFLSLTGSIGDFLVSIDAALKKGDRLHNFFKRLGEVLASPVKILSDLAGALGDVFSGVSSSGIASSFNNITAAATPLQGVIAVLTDNWERFTNSIKDSVDASDIISDIGDAISGIGVAIGHALSGMNFETIFSAIRTGLFAGLVLMFKQFLGRGSFLNQISKGFGAGIISNISGIFNGLNGSMKAMQQNIKAKTLKEIAIAIALLAASVLALSLVDPKRLNSSLGAMTIMLGELIGAMALLDKIAKTGGFIKLPFIVAGLIGLAIAIDLLTISVLALSRLSWDELLRGLAGVGGLLGGIVVAVKPLSAGSGGLIRASVGLIALAVAMKILASAVADFAELSWEELAKGLIGVGGGLVIIAGAMQVMPKGIVLQSAALIALALSLKILADAVSKFASMNWGTMGRGLAGVAGSLVVIAGAMHLMPKSMVLTAAGLALVALSLGKISDAVVKMGGMSISQIAKGLSTLAGSLIILAGALRAMSGTIGGALALGAAATGIALLAPALVMLGRQSWGQIIKGMVALGTSLAVIGVAGKAVAPVVPALLGLGAAAVLLGAGLALAGAGVLLFSAGLSALVVAGPAAVGILIAAINEFLEAIPKMATNFALGLLAVVQAFAKTAPQFVDAMVKIINSLLDVIIQSSPKMIQAIDALIKVVLQVIADNRDEIIAAGFELLISLLQGIKDNISQVTKMVADIIVKFLQAVTANLGRILKAGADLLAKFLLGIANNLTTIVTSVATIVTRFISALAANWVRIITAGADLVIKLVEGIAKNLGRIITAGANAIISYIKGIENNIGNVISAGVNVVIKFIEGIGKNAVRLANAAGRVIVDFLNGLTKAINTYAPQIRAASLRLGFAIIDGLTFGLASKAESAYSKAREIAGKLVDILKAPWKVFSPSRTMIELGGNITSGLAVGLGKNNQNVYNAGAAMSSRALMGIKSAVQPEAIREIGQYVGKEFANGLQGSQEDIRSAFTELNNKLTQAMTDARKTISSEEDKLEELRKAKKPDTDAIAKAQKIIDDNEALLTRSIATRKALTSSLRDEKNELLSLTAQYDQISEKIQKAQEVLAQAQQTRKDALTGYTQQFSDLPDIPQLLDSEGNPVDQLASYMEALTNQTKAVQAYGATLDQLRKLGLDDATYKKLLEEGTADQSFANQLLAGGKTAVESLNTLDANLMRVSKTLATNAANNLYNGGVEAAKGLLRGLTSQNQKIREAMDNLADDIVGEIKAKLRIKSPSKVFEEIGIYAMRGLADGFSNSSKLVTNAIVGAASSAIDSIKNSMSKITDIVSSELNPNPVITPILDLTQVRSQMGVLASITNVTPITAAASYGQASLISSEQIASQLEEMGAALSGPVVKFEQNNYSPKALTDIEIYRQTRNQLSQIKSALSSTT